MKTLVTVALAGLSIVSLATGAYLGGNQYAKAEVKQYLEGIKADLPEDTTLNWGAIDADVLSQKAWVRNIRFTATSEEVKLTLSAERTTYEGILEQLSDDGAIRVSKAVSEGVEARVDGDPGMIYRTPRMSVEGFFCDAELNRLLDEGPLPPNWAKYCRYDRADSATASLKLDDVTGTIGATTVRGFDAGALEMMEVDGIQFHGPDGGGITIERMEFTASNPIEGFATRSLGTVKDLAIVLTGEEDAKVREFLSPLGVEAISLDLTAAQNWDSGAGRYEWGPMDFDFKGLAKLRMAAIVANLPPVETLTADLTAFQLDPDAAEEKLKQHLLAAEFGGIEVGLKDHALIGKLLDGMAEKQGIQRDQLAQGMGEMARGFLQALASPERAAVAARSITRFLAEGGALSLSVKPKESLPLAGMAILAANPGMGRQMLDLDIRHKDDI